MTSWECYENKWFYMKYIGEYLGGEILLARECISNQNQTTQTRHESYYKQLETNRTITMIGFKNSASYILWNSIRILTYCSNIWYILIFLDLNLIEHVLFSPCFFSVFVLDGKMYINRCSVVEPADFVTEVQRKIMGGQLSCPTQ